MSVLVLPASPGNALRLAVHRFPVPPIAIAGVIVMTGVGAAVATTSDPEWWRLHFSRLGMFDDLSGNIFNITLVVVGIAIALSGLALGEQLRRAVETGVVTSAHAPRVIPLGIVGLGLSLSIAGIIPLSISEFLHDRAANGMLISFTTAVLSSRWLLRGLSRAVTVVTNVTGLTVTTGTVLFVAGIINLALLEVVVFTLIFLWVSTVSTTLRRMNPLPVAHPVAGRPVAGRPVAGRPAVARPAFDCPVAEHAVVVEPPTVATRPTSLTHPVAVERPATRQCRPVRGRRRRLVGPTVRAVPSRRRGSVTARTALTAL